MANQPPDQQQMVRGPVTPGPYNPNWPRTWNTIDASGILVPGPCRLWALLMTSSGAAAGPLATFYVGRDTNGRIFHLFRANASEDMPVTIPSGVDIEGPLYADFTVITVRVTAVFTLLRAP